MQCIFVTGRGLIFWVQWEGHSGFDIASVLQKGGNTAKVARQCHLPRSKTLTLMDANSGGTVGQLFVSHYHWSWVEVGEKDQSELVSALTGEGPDCKVSSSVVRLLVWISHLKAGMNVCHTVWWLWLSSENRWGEVRQLLWFHCCLCVMMMEA